MHRKIPIAFLLYGYIASDKTTLAKEIEQGRRAIRFTPDE